MRLKPLISGFVVFIGIFAMMTTIDIQGASLVTNDLANQRERSQFVKPPLDRLLVSDKVQVTSGQVARAIFCPLAGPGAENDANTRLIERGIDRITIQRQATTAMCTVLIPASFSLDYVNLGSDDRHAGYVDEKTGIRVCGFSCDDDSQGYYCQIGALVQDTTDCQYDCRLESDCEPCSRLLEESHDASFSMESLGRTSS